jgi:hypothetical protein
MKKLPILIAFLLVPMSASAQVAGVRVCSFPNCGLVSPADLVSSTLFYKLDGSQNPTADQPMGNYKIQMNPTCVTYSFNAGASTIGPINVYGHFVQFTLDGYAGNAATTGAVAYVTGTTTFTGSTGNGNTTTTTNDLAGGSDGIVYYDGTPGATGFIAESPQKITVNIVSAVNAGTADICQF